MTGEIFSVHGVELDRESSGRGFESLRARQINQGVAAHAAAPFSFDCEVIVKFMGGKRGKTRKTIYFRGGKVASKRQNDYDINQFFPG